MRRTCRFVFDLFSIVFSAPFWYSVHCLLRATADSLPQSVVGSQQRNVKIMEILSRRLRELRGERSQAAFARELGITQQRYANYESGIREPDLTTLCRIAALTTGSVDALLGVKDLAPPDRSRDKVDDLKKAIITLLKEY